MAYVGYSNVANQAQTTPGCASGVVADANNGYGDDTGGSGVVDTYSCLIPPPPVTNYYIILETNFYILQEDGYKIYIQ
ncbi:hypothetical protein EB001_04660 [bacterium]|nr:hypothetical protein [bacterium]